MRDLTFRIRQARRKAVLSQTALATQVGVNRSAVAQWERPGGSRPTSGNLSKVAIATAVQFEWLATGRGRMRVGSDVHHPQHEQALMLKFFAHDEVEERVLLGLRKLEFWQTISVAELVESLARGKLAV